MGRPRKTVGDRLVERLCQNVADVLTDGDVKKVQFAPAEAERLELVRRVADDLHALEQAWFQDRDAGRFTTMGSRGQQVANPLIGEVRATRAQLDKLVSGITVDMSGGRSMSPSEIGRHAANKRHNPSPAELMAHAQQRWAQK